jgi:F0F1-type ATP synthase beta subunit
MWSLNGELPYILTALLINQPDDQRRPRTIWWWKWLSISGDNVVRCIAMDVTDGLVEVWVSKTPAARS